MDSDFGKGTEQRELELNPSKTSKSGCAPFSGQNKRPRNEYLTVSDPAIYSNSPLVLPTGLRSHRITTILLFLQHDGKTRGPATDRER
jgi:hypothetical protein